MTNKDIMCSLEDLPEIYRCPSQVCSFIGVLASAIPAVAGIASSLFGGGGGGDSEDESNSLYWAAKSNQTGQEQTDQAVQEALADYVTMLEAASKYLQPYYNAGTEGLNALSAALTPEGGLSQVDMVSGLPPGAGADLMNFLTQTPAYQFPLQEGINALDRSASSKGMLLSGAQQKGINQYGQNFALSNALNPAMANYQAYLKNISGLAGMGQTAGTQLGNWQITNALNMGNTRMKGAEIRGSLAAADANMRMNNLSQDIKRDALDSANSSNSLIGSLLGGIAGLPWDQIGNSLSGLFGGNQFSGSTASGGISSSYTF